jgi:hypothetical protein
MTMQRSDAFLIRMRAILQALFAFVLLLLTINASALRAQTAELSIGATDLSGAVVGSNGPEAGRSRSE